MVGALESTLAFNEANFIFPTTFAEGKKISRE